MVIQNIVMKFNNFEFFNNFCDILNLSSAHACRMVSVNKKGWATYIRSYLTNYWTNTRHVCTYLIAFSMEIPTTVKKFNNFEIYDNLCKILNPSSAIVCRMASVNKGGMSYVY